MAADNDTNSGSGHPSIQIQGKGGRDDREGEGNGGNSKPNDAAPEVGEGRRQRRASKRSRRIRNNNGNGNLKLFRRHNNPHPRNIPAARFIQGYNEHSYICEHQEDESESEREYLPTAARRRGEGAVVHRLQRQHHEWATATRIEEEEAKHDASALSIFAGKKRNARCHCFNCW